MISRILFLCAIGGTIDESVYIDGVVFRKNVSHKKMGANASRTNPRILLISEGIEFQRADMKLSSMDTLIEQEEKHMELAVQKIMSLKPGKLFVVVGEVKSIMLSLDLSVPTDIILVGKAIGRKAQELLCEHNAVVMQNVKAHLLERIA
jgi:chaperonin GroEL (HSP60 family)